MSIAYCTPHTTLLDSLYKLLTVQTTHCTNYSLCKLLTVQTTLFTGRLLYSLYRLLTVLLEDGQPVNLLEASECRVALELTHCANYSTLLCRLLTVQTTLLTVLLEDGQPVNLLEASECRVALELALDAPPLRADADSSRGEGASEGAHRLLALGPPLRLLLALERERVLLVQLLALQLVA